MNEKKESPKPKNELLCPLCNSNQMYIVGYSMLCLRCHKHWPGDEFLELLKKGEIPIG